MSQELANTILAQLGGNRFVAMTGAKNFVYHENTLLFTVPSTKHGKANMRITLDPSDTYTVELFKTKRDYTTQQLEIAEDVYCDSLANTFTRQTGLFTRL